MTEQTRQRLYATMNLEARHELQAIRDHAAHFEAVAYFEAYRRNAQTLYFRPLRQSGALPVSVERDYRRREQEIGRAAIERFNLKPSDLLEFIKIQTDWWNDARRLGPAAMAEEYKRNIHASMSLFSRLTRKDFAYLSAQVGDRGGWMKPILEVIFPSWLEDQRDLTRRSLEGWAGKFFSGLPPPFPLASTDIEAFCSWLENAGLYQYYWHFQRLVDIGRRDDVIHRAAAASEAVAFASLVELIANRACGQRGIKARGKTLAPKLYLLFDSSGPADFEPLLRLFKKLTRTDAQTLKQRLAQIRRVKQGGKLNAVVAALLELLVVRNEGTHLGLNQFSNADILRMIETMAMASLVIWKAR